MIQYTSFSGLFCRKPLVCSSGIGQGYLLLDVVHPAFLLPTKASPALQSALKDGIEEDVACDTPEPCKFPSLDSCQKRFL